MYDDEEEWFRAIFASSNKENAIQNQYEFFVQRMGGPPLFSQRRGEVTLLNLLHCFTGLDWLPLMLLEFNNQYILCTQP